MTDVNFAAQLTSWKTEVDALGGGPLSASDNARATKLKAAMASNGVPPLASRDQESEYKSIFDNLCLKQSR